MLDIDRTKQLLNDPNISDKEVEEIRNKFGVLTEILFQKWSEKKEQKKLEEINSQE